MPRLLLHHALTCSLPSIGGPPGGALRERDQHDGGGDQHFDGGGQCHGIGDQPFGGGEQHLGGEGQHFAEGGQHLGEGNPMMGGGHQLVNGGGLGVLGWPPAPRPRATAGGEAEPHAASAALHGSPADVMAGFPEYGDVRGAQELQACYRSGCCAICGKARSCSHFGCSDICAKS